MKRILTVAVLWGCLASEALFANGYVPAAITTRAYCNVAVAAAQNQFKWIFSNWIGRKDSPWNVERNFQRLRKENDKRFGTIINVADLGLSEVDTIETLKAKLRELDQHRAQSLIVFTDVRVANDEFEMSLFALEDAMASLITEIDRLERKCEVHESNLAKILDHLDKFQDVVNTYRAYVYQSAIKAENLYLIIIEFAKAKLYAGYIKKTNQRLEAVQALIHDALALDSLYGEYLVWWQHNSIKIGIGGDLHRTYLMYYEPLLLMQEQLSKVEGFYQNIATTIKPSPTKERVLAEINQSKALIEAEIRELKTKGWSGQRDRQIELNRQRAALVRNESCQRAIKKHLELASKATSMAHFKSVSQFYRQAVVVCDGGAPL